MGFAEKLDYFPYQVHSGEKSIKKPPKDKIDLKCSCITGSIIIGYRQPLLFCFILDKSPGYKKISEPDFKPLQNLKSSLLSEITFYLEFADRKKLILRVKL